MLHVICLSQFAAVYTRSRSARAAIHSREIPKDRYRRTTCQCQLNPASNILPDTTAARRSLDQHRCHQSDYTVYWRSSDSTAVANDKSFLRSVDATSVTNKVP